MKIYKWVPISNNDAKKKLPKNDNKENSQKSMGGFVEDSCFSDSQATATTDFVSTGIFSEDSNSQGSEPQLPKRLKAD